MPHRHAHDQHGGAKGSKTINDRAEMKRRMEREDNNNPKQKEKNTYHQGTAPRARKSAQHIRRCPTLRTMTIVGRGMERGQVIRIGCGGGGGRAQSASCRSLLLAPYP